MNATAANLSGACSSLVLVRHAHTDMAGMFCGISDPPLSAQGRAQLSVLRERLKAYPLTQVFSSPLQRARQTAEAIAQEFGLQVQYVEFLHELAFGSWEGLDWDQVQARDPEYAQLWLDLYPSVPAPGGENFPHFVRRIEQAISDIADHTGDGCATVVTHAGVIRTFLGQIARVQDVAYEAAQCDHISCCEVWRQQGQWRLPEKKACEGRGDCAARPEMRD
jgi:broad specificity phosphatase PhoE